LDKIWSKFRRELLRLSAKPPVARIYRRAPYCVVWIVAPVSRLPHVSGCCASSDVQRHLSILDD